MDFRECMLCGQTKIIFDLVRMKSADGGNMGWRCQDGECPLPKSEPKHVPQEAAIHPLQEDYGFTKPEDGSERRFVFNAVKNGQSMPWQDQKITVPWVKFRFWWLVHNAVAHPLIAVAPRRTFFQFHDFTSRKMHGK